MASSGEDRVTWENYEKKNHRPHMDRSCRAKIFLPFNALEGLYEVLGQKEEKPDRRIELSEDAAQLLNEQLTDLKTGDFVSVTYYDVTGSAASGRYLTVSGVLSGISYELKTLRVRSTVIPIPDICRIEKRPGGDMPCPDDPLF